MQGTITVGDAVRFATDRTRQGALLAESSLATFVGIWTGFSRYASRACGVRLLTDIDQDVIERFLDAPTRTGLVPSVATQHSRRGALRFLFPRPS